MVPVLKQNKIVEWRNPVSPISKDEKNIGAAGAGKTIFVGTLEINNYIQMSRPRCIDITLSTLITFREI